MATLDRCLPPFPASAALDNQCLDCSCYNDSSGSYSFEQGKDYSLEENYKPIAASSHVSKRSDSRISSAPDTNRDLDPGVSCLPGQPSVSSEPVTVHEFLHRELHTPVLDELYRRLWLVARRSGSSIDPLHQQRIKGKEVVPAEDINLHLVWRYDTVYVKPIPICLLNYEFWMTYLCPSVNDLSLSSSAASMQSLNCAQQLDRSLVLGLLRSYSYLVQHPVDLSIAQQAYLIPRDISWTEWSRFMTYFRRIRDCEVARRYHYGQLRLSRLNYAVRFFRPPSAQTFWFYQIPYWSVREYVHKASFPLVFTFASLSLVLSSMQVINSIPGERLGIGTLELFQERAVYIAFWVISLIVLLVSFAVWALLLGIPCGVIIWQLLWGFRNRRSRVEGSSI